MSQSPAASFVAPGRSRSGAVPLVLGGIAIILLVLALIGLPLIPLPSRTGHGHQFATFGTEFGRWNHHAGWRYTSDSWFYWAGLTACLFGGVVWWLRVRGFTRRYALVAVPAAAVLALGPIAQAAIGLQRSDYATSETLGDNAVLNALGIAGVLVLLYLAELVRRFARSSGGRGRPLPGR